jgi:phosphopantetheinyl transferase
MSTHPAMILPVRLARPEGSHRATLCLARMPQEAILSRQLTDPFLHPAESACLDRMTTSLRRQSYLIGRYCAKEALTRQLGGEQAQRILIRAGVFGQPLVSAPANDGTGVSISHSADYGCALAFDPAQPMGIDLEAAGTRHERALRGQLTEAEAYRVATVWRHDNACVLLWTVKEAVGKAMRTGLTVPTWLYEVSAIQRVGLFLVATFQHLLQYKVLSFQWEGVFVSIALPARTTLEMPMESGILPICFT